MAGIKAGTLCKGFLSLKHFYQLVMGHCWKKLFCSANDVEQIRGRENTSYVLVSVQSCSLPLSVRQLRTLHCRTCKKHPPSPPDWGDSSPGGSEKLRQQSKGES